METTADTKAQLEKSEFSRGLGLFDSTMLVVGVMIGSGIFIVSAEMSRQIGSPGWLFVAWMIAGASHHCRCSFVWRTGRDDASRWRHVRLPARSLRPALGIFVWMDIIYRDSDRHHCGSGGSLRQVFRVVWPTIAEDVYLVAPIRISEHYAISLSTAQLVAVVIILLLTFANTRGLAYGRLIQNSFTVGQDKRAFRVDCGGNIYRKKCSRIEHELS
jgi:APA family basic amino acid/polyamine antiporter